MLLIDDCVNVGIGLPYLLVPSAWRKVDVCLLFCDKITYCKNGANAVFFGFCNHCTVTDINGV